MAETPTNDGGLDFYNSEAAASVAIDMGAIESGQMQPSGSGRRDHDAADAGAKADPTVGFGLPQNMATSMFTTMLSGAREQVRARGVTGDVHTQIDYLRPYFDVETSEVQQRLLWAFNPRKGERLLQEQDLYCPTLLVFTLAALLVAGMKSQERASVGAEGTLIGTALGSAFSFWAVSSLALYGAAYMLQLKLRLAQVCGLTGYALSGVCLPLLVGLSVPVAAAFYGALLTLGGCSAAALGRAFASVAESPAHTLPLAALAAGINLTATAYLHWRYFS